MEAIKIDKKIVSYKVVDGKEKEKTEVVNQVKQDINPLYTRIDNRPESELEALSSKFKFSSSTGRHSAYIIISFIPVKGVINGEEITVERPIDFFMPVTQATDEAQEWASSTMRMLSLAARSGFTSQALQDMKKTKGTGGQVSCGTKVMPDGVVKPLRHDSIVAAIAYQMEQMLIKRGFMDENGIELPALVNAKNYAKRIGSVTNLGLDMIEVQSTDMNVIDLETNEQQSPMPIGKACPDCKEMTLVNQGGCDICACGYSKCS